MRAPPEPHPEALAPARLCARGLQLPSNRGSGSQHAKPISRSRAARPLRVILLCIIMNYMTAKGAMVTTKARSIDLPGAARSARPRDSRAPGMARRRGAAAAEVGDLDQHVGYMLRRAQIAVFADFIATQRGRVARPGQFSVLSVIGRNPGITQSQLCATLGIKRANLVAVIDHLEELDLARREPSKTDRRSNRLRL